MISAFCLLLSLLCALTLSVSSLAQAIFAWQDYKEDQAHRDEEEHQRLKSWLSTVCGALPTVEMPIDDTVPTDLAAAFSPPAPVARALTRTVTSSSSSNLCEHPLTCDHWLCLTEIFGGTRSP